MKSFDFINFITKFNEEFEKDFSDRKVKIVFSKQFREGLAGKTEIIKLTIRSNKRPHMVCVMILKRTDDEIIVDFFSTFLTRKKDEDLISLVSLPPPKKFYPFYPEQLDDNKTSVLGAVYLFCLAEKLNEQKQIREIHIALDRLAYKYDYEFTFTKKFNLEKRGRKITMKIDDEDNRLRFKNAKVIDALINYPDCLGDNKTRPENFYICSYVYLFSYGEYICEIRLIRKGDAFYLYEKNLKYKIPLSKDNRAETVRNEVWQFMQGIEKRIRPYILLDSFKENHAKETDKTSV